jgi:hypothetical protein
MSIVDYDKKRFRDTLGYLEVDTGNADEWKPDRPRTKHVPHYVKFDETKKMKRPPRKV